MNALPRVLSCFLAGIAVFAGLPALALINPNFTPVHLVAQSDQVLDLAFGGVKDGAVTAKIKETVKGKSGAKTIAFNLSTSAYTEHTDAVAAAIAGLGSEPALFFTGKMRPEGSDSGGGSAPAEDGSEKGFLHMGIKWYVFDKGSNDVWELDKIDEKMLATWNGDTAMLRAAVAYILGDPDAVIPCEETGSWGKPSLLGKVSGRVCACQGVALTDAGEPALLVAAAGGDHLFQWNAKAKQMQDITAARKLVSKSLAAAWGDWNGDGRFDLASWNGEALTIYLQDADGTFHAGPMLPKSVLTNGVVSLAVLDVGVAGQPAVLIDTSMIPLLWSPAATNSSATPVSATIAASADRGKAGRCLVADFDNDGLLDILQLFVNGSLLYKGTGPGKFAAPVACDVALGTGPVETFIGDFDQDGRLDIFSTGDSICLWNNRGNGHFVDTFNATGEPSYKGSVNACGGAMSDFNNDGLQDITFFYPSAMPIMNFNRGFRSFGRANKLDFQSNLEALPGAEAGQQAGCWTDLVGDGFSSLNVVLTDGTTLSLPFESTGEKGRGVKVALAGKSARVGPVNVTAWRGKRCFGAWVVTAGEPVQISQAEAGPITLKWRFPGGQPQSKELLLENAPVKFVLP